MYGKAHFPTEAMESIDVAPAVPAEPKVFSDDHLFGCQESDDDSTDELPNGQVGKRFGEACDKDGLNAARTDACQPLPEGLDHGCSASTQDLFRVGGEGQHEGGQIFLPRFFDEIAKDLLVAQVKSIEITDGDGCSFGKCRASAEPLEDLHGIREW